MYYAYCTGNGGDLLMHHSYDQSSNAVHFRSVKKMNKRDRGCVFMCDTVLQKTTSRNSVRYELLLLDKQDAGSDTIRLLPML